MKRILSTAVLAASLFTGAAACRGGEAGTIPVEHPAAADPKAAAAGDLAWDARVFENNPKKFGFVKRIDGENSVSWVLQVKDGDESFRIKNYDGYEDHYEAVFLDEDGLAVGSVRLYPHLTNVDVGELVKFTLTMPTEDEFSGAKKVVVKLRSPQ